MESRKGDIMCQHPRPEIYESGGVSKVLLAVVSALDGDTTLMQCAMFPEQHTATGQKNTTIITSSSTQKRTETGRATCVKSSLLPFRTRRDVAHRIVRRIAFHLFLFTLHIPRSALTPDLVTNEVNIAR